jgi:hypothetical protein
MESHEGESKARGDGTTAPISLHSVSLQPRRALHSIIFNFEGGLASMTFKSMIYDPLSLRNPQFRTSRNSGRQSP